MPNNWFSFKQFTVKQDKTAMKVGTDGVLLGAWTNVTECENILDIGTGTGLIALMLAQRAEAQIDTIEIDSEAAKQAEENIAESPWSKRIRVFCSSFQDFYPGRLSRYDLIVCNPPFFNNSLKANTQPRSLARHNDSLSLKELISGSKSILKPFGKLSIITPAENEKLAVSLAEENSLYPMRILRIRPIPGREFKRVLMDFSFSLPTINESEICIETGIRHQYSKEYIDLTREYYLEK